MADKKKAETPEDDEAKGGGKKKLLVVGLVVDVIRSLGAEVDRQIEEEVSR